ncbi:tail fiber assembly protein [Rahnella inusitata]|uniref:tail fiber assembly protein n=1 Tax=Rahnella inusitata TaxID=58169 RepID=UPI0039B0C9E4
MTTRYFFLISNGDYISDMKSTDDESVDPENLLSSGYIEVDGETYAQGDLSRQYVNGKVVPDGATSTLPAQKYYFVLSAEFFILGVFVASTDAGVVSAEKEGMTEVSEADFKLASPLSRYVDGAVVSPEVIKEFELRYFIDVDAELYVIGSYIAFNDTDVTNFASKTEVTEEQYKRIGPYVQYKDGDIAQGEVREPVLSKEANEAIKAARTETASQKISLLTDLTDPDLVDAVSDDDVALLKAWKKYRISLALIDTSAPVWPDIPTE